VSLSSLIRKMIEAGAPPEAIALAIEAIEDIEAAAAEAAASRSPRKERNARYYQNKRLKASEIKTLKTDQDAPKTISDAAPRTCAQVVTPSLPSLRSEEVKPVSPDGDTRPLTPKFAKPNGFARFWEAYPNKVGKAAAEAAYAKALKRISGPDPPSVLLAGVERAKASRAWGEGFIPHPKTWLSQGRWDDEPAEVIPLKASHERPHPDAKFAARQANLATLERGADLAARLHRQP
jgi:hypothetical protein